jgi:hypothetical protein
MISIRNKLSKKVENLKFFQITHEYNLKGKKLISVSELVELYKKPFDPDGSVTAKCALRNGITPREQADIWKAKNKESTDKGTLTHQICENLLKGIECMPEGITQEIAIKVPLIREVCEELKPYHIASEQIIFNEEYGIAGTPDELTWYNNMIDIWDFKTDKNPIEIDDNRFNKYFLPPLQDLPANSFYYYALKMSIYRYILELDGFPVNTLGLLHIRPKEIKEIMLPYLEQECKLLIEDYKKKQEVMINDIKNS